MTDSMPEQVVHKTRRPDKLAHRYRLWFARCVFDVRESRVGNVSNLAIPGVCTPYVYEAVFPEKGQRPGAIHSWKNEE